MAIRVIRKDLVIGEQVYYRNFLNDNVYRWCLGEVIERELGLPIEHIEDVEPGELKQKLIEANHDIIKIEELT